MATLRPALGIGAALALSLAAPGVPQAGGGVAAGGVAASGWTLLEAFPPETEAARDIRTTSGQAMSLDWDAMRATLGAAPREADVARVADSKAVIALPRPDGVMERFALVESSIMEAPLQAKVPEIRTYLGQGIDRRAATVRLDRTPQGFHAQVLAPSEAGRTGVYYIDPAVRGDASHYVSHWRGALAGPGAWNCTTEQPDDAYFARLAAAMRLRPRGPGPTVQRTTYRLAMAATGEYTAFASLPGSPNTLAGLGAIVTTVNRVTQLLENDCAVRLVLVGDTPNIVYANASTDPYSGTQAQKQAQNQLNLDTVIGPANYDVGHLVDVGSGGNSGGNGSVCSSTSKGRGYTGSASPTGDAFWVDYVAHEIGHQIGGTHTFNGVGGSCGSQWTGTTAYEPGSGTSIMAYAGICGADDLASASPPLGASDPAYSFTSIQQITAWTNIAPCGTSPASTPNHPPAAVVGGGYTVPTNTAFSLTGSASDPDFGDSISYSWEQADLGPQLPLGPDTGAHEPLFRTYMHSGGNERAFPTLNPLTGAPLPGENLARFARSSAFKLVVRDNVAGGGGVGIGTVAVSFAASTDGGFRVTQPAGGTLCAGQPVPVVWTVAGTQNPPVSCELVDITLSFDGGQTFPHALAAGIANSGFALVTLPPVAVENARIKVSAVGNVFYAVNPGSIRVQTQPPQFAGFTAWPACGTTCPNATVTIIPGPISGSEPIEVALQKQAGSVWSDVAVTGTGQVFQLTSLTRSRSGNYRIAARNGCGTAFTAERRIEVGVTFDAQPQRQAVAPCAPAIFSVQARGACSVSYQWLRNGVPLAPADLGGRAAGTTGPTLTINGCRYGDEGTYACRVTDSCETRTSDEADLALTTPVWEERAMDAAPAIGGSGEFWTCAYDERRGVLVLYGGLTSTGQDSNALWEYDGFSWTVRQAGYPALTTGGGQPLYDGLWPPSPRASAMVYNPDDGKVYLIAPFAASYPLAILTWDGTAWARPYYGPVNGDTGRTHAAYDRVNRRIVIVRAVGGSNNSELLVYDPATNQMTGPVAMQPQVQLGNADSALWFDERRGAVVWYNNINQFVLPTMWTLSASSQWTPLASNPIRLTYATPIVYDPVRFQGIGIGGELSSGSYDARTFGWPGLQTKPWSTAMPPANDWALVLLAPAAPPGPPGNWRPAFWQGMAFDTRRRAMVAAGRAVQPSPLSYAWRTFERRYRDAAVFDKPAAAVPMPGGAVALRSYAEGAPGLSFQWRRDGADLNDGPGPGGSTISGARSATLTIAGVGAANAGAYTCRATNLCGSAVSTIARLGCAADFNGQSGADLLDIFAFLEAWFAGCVAPGAPVPSCPKSADIDGINGVDLLDIFAFLGAWFAGC